MSSKEIEILRTGTFTAANGVVKKFSLEDIKEVVESYNPTNFKAPLIISHDTKGLPDRKLVSSNFAFGAPKVLKLVGDRVKAVFDKVAPEFVQWVRNGNLLAISPSIYLPDSPNNPTPGKLSLRHIAALGNEPPAIKGLSPLSMSELCFGEPEEGTLEFSMTPMGIDDALLEAQLWQRLREFLIEKFDMDAADRVVPSFMLEALQMTAAQPDQRDMEKEELWRRLNELSDRLYLLESPRNINYQEYKMPKGMNKKRMAKALGCTEQEAADYMADPSKLSADQRSKLEAISMDMSEEEKQRADALAAREVQLAAREKELLRKDFASFAEGLYKTGKLTPAIAPQEDLVNFMEALGAESVDFSEGEKNPLDWFKQFCDRLPKQVDFGTLPAHQEPVESLEQARKKAAQDYADAYKNG